VGCSFTVLGADGIIVSLEPNDARFVLGVPAHEVGHALGLPHTTSTWHRGSWKATGSSGTMTHLTPNDSIRKILKPSATTNPFMFPINPKAACCVWCALLLCASGEDTVPNSGDLLQADMAARLREFAKNNNMGGPRRPISPELNAVNSTVLEHYLVTDK